MSTRRAVDGGVSSCSSCVAAEEHWALHADLRTAWLPCLATRDVAERIMSLREHISLKMADELQLVPAANTNVRRKCVAPPAALVCMHCLSRACRQLLL